MDKNNHIIGIAILLIVLLIGVPIGILITTKMFKEPAAPTNQTIIERKITPPAKCPPVGRYPPGCLHDNYNRGWEDAHCHRSPPPECRKDPHYMNGYKQYIGIYNNGFKLDIGINK
jgi:hypothetical protein